jgi:hypothetical protein
VLSRAPPILVIELVVEPRLILLRLPLCGSSVGGNGYCVAEETVVGEAKVSCDARCGDAIFACTGGRIAASSVRFHPDCNKSHDSLWHSVGLRKSEAALRHQSKRGLMGTGMLRSAHEAAPNKLIDNAKDRDEHSPMLMRALNALQIDASEARPPHLLQSHLPHSFLCPSID